MPTIFDKENAKLDQTIRIYDQFYNTDMIVNSNEFDIVFSFFKNICATEQIAGNYTSFLFRVSNDSGIPVMEFMDDLNRMKTNKMLINSFLAFYLNKFRSKTSLYGQSTSPRPVQPVARNIVQ